MNIISKQQAKSKGLAYYFTGKPCKHGHISYRHVSGGACHECKLRNGAMTRSKPEYKAKVKEWHRRHHLETYTTKSRREKYRKCPESELLARAKWRAKSKNIPFDITREDVVIPNICPVFGVKFDFDSKLHAPSLDRIRPDLGYIKGNVRVICMRANRLKDNGTIEEFEKILAYMKEPS